MTSVSYFFQKLKHKLNRITGAKLFTINERHFLFFNYSITF